MLAGAVDLAEQLDVLQLVLVGVVADAVQAGVLAAPGPGEGLNGIPSTAFIIRPIIGHFAR